MAKIHLSKLNRAGLDTDTILLYQQTGKCQKYINLIRSNEQLPAISLYHNTNTIADGIHRICAYLYLGILEFDFKYY